MGKVRRLRQKYHANLAKDDNGKGDASDLPQKIPKLIPKIQGTAAEGASLSGNMFAGLQIKLDEVVCPPVNHKTDEVDTMSVVSSEGRSREGTKKERKKARHEELMKKIDAIRTGQRAEKERRKREKTVIVGDVQPMINALPSLEELLADSKLKKEKQKPKKTRGTLKQGEAQKEFLSDIQLFMAVHQDPVFNKNPFGAVSLSVENRIHYNEDN